MKKVILVFVFCVFLSSCTTEQKSKSYICKGIGVDSSEIGYNVTVRTAPLDAPEGEDTIDTFSARSAQDIITELLSGRDEVMYKSCELMVFGEGLTDGQKRELLSAFVNRNEFQLKCKAYESENAGEYITQNANPRESDSRDFMAYYRIYMNVEERQ